MFNSPNAGTQPNYQTSPQAPGQSSRGYDAVTSPYETQSDSQTGGPSQHGDDNRTALRDIQRYDSYLRHDPSTYSTTLIAYDLANPLPIIT
jgi:hypothetical protein